jgi:hypothetical protein
MRPSDKNEGSVLSTTIDKRCYIPCRWLPPFFEYHGGISYTHARDSSLCQRAAGSTQVSRRSAGIIAISGRGRVETTALLLRRDAFDVAFRSGLPGSTS